MVRAIMRLFSYLYHLLFSLFIFGLGAIGWFSPNTRLELPMLPWWEDPALSRWLFFGGLFGLLSLALAWSGRIRILFRLWTVIALAIFVYGFFLTPYGFRSPGQFQNAVLLASGGLVAAIGSWLRVPERS